MTEERAASGTGRDERAPALRVGERLLLIALLLVPIWAAGPVPTIDGPQHALMGWMLCHLHDPGRDLERYFALQAPLSGGGYALLVALLHTAGFAIRRADQVALSAVLGLEAIALERLVVAAQGARSPWRALAWVAPFAVLYYYGTWNYVLGTAIGLLAFAVALRIAVDARAGRAVARRRFALLGALLFVDVLAHGFAAAIAGLVIGLGFVGAIPPRRLPPWLGRLALAALPTAAWIGMMAFVAHGDSAEQTCRVTSSLARPIFDLDGLRALGRSLFETPYRTLLPADALVAVAALLAVRAAARRRPEALAIGAALIALVALQPLVPEHLRLWCKVRIRFVPWILAFAVAGAAVDDLSHRVRRLLAAGALAVAAWTSLAVLRDNQRLAAMQREYESGIGQVAPVPARRLAIRPDPEHPLRPGENLAGHLFTYYMMDEGGVFPDVYSGRREPHVLARKPAYDGLSPPEPPLPVSPAMGGAALAWQGLGYDEVLLWDPRPDELRAFLDFGYRLRFHDGGLFRLTAPARRLRVTLSAASVERLFAGRAGALEVEAFGPLPWPLGTAPLLPVEGGRLRAELPSLPSLPLRIIVADHSRPAGAPPLVLEADLSAGDVTLDK